MTCPKCKSTEWKLASLVHAEGISHVDTASKGAGIGISGSGVGLGIGKSSTEGIHQSELSKLVAPPKPISPPLSPPTKFGLIFGSVGACALAWLFQNWWLLSPILFFLIAGLLLKPEEEEPKEFIDERMEDWKKTQVCQRCGEVYLPKK